MKAPIVAAAAALTLAIPAPARAQQVVGVISALQNHARVRKPRAPMPLPATLRQRIALADEIHTGAKSQVQMLLLDKSVFTVGANAKLTIDRYVYDPNRSTRSMGATVTRGAFRFMSGRRTTGSSTINTPVATIGIRGTLVDAVIGPAAALIAADERGVGRGVRSDPNTASLIVLRGPGRATQGNLSPGAIDVTAGGRTVSADRPMLAIFVPGPGRAPIGPFVISAAGLMQLQAVLFPSLAEYLGLEEPVDPNAAPARPATFPPADNPQRPRYPRYPGRDPFNPGTLPGSDGPPSGFNPMDNFPGGQPPRRPPAATPTPTPTPTRDPGPAPNAPPANAAPQGQQDPLRAPADVAPARNAQPDQAKQDDKRAKGKDPPR